MVRYINRKSIFSVTLSIKKLTVPLSTKDSVLLHYSPVMSSRNALPYQKPFYLIPRMKLSHCRDKASLVCFK